MFIASDEHVLCWGRTLWRWRQTLLALEKNAFELEMNTVRVESGLRDYTMIAIVIATYL